jgi:hypothetical protein
MTIGLGLTAWSVYDIANHGVSEYNRAGLVAGATAVAGDIAFEAIAGKVTKSLKIVKFAKRIYGKASGKVRALYMRSKGAGRFKVKVGSDGRGYLQRKDINISKKDAHGINNINLMKNGKAPLGKDGNPINLHHDGQEMNSRLIELEQTYHKKNSSSLHPYKGPSRINRNKFKTERQNY